eukprot:56813-Rhodomonas_salina.1
MHARGARTLVFPGADLRDDTGNPELLAAPVALLQPSVHHVIHLQPVAPLQNTQRQSGKETNERRTAKRVCENSQSANRVCEKGRQTSCRTQPVLFA